MEPEMHRLAGKRSPWAAAVVLVPGLLPVLSAALGVLVLGGARSQGKLDRLDPLGLVVGFGLPLAIFLGAVAFVVWSALGEAGRRPDAWHAGLAAVLVAVFCVLWILFVSALYWGD